MQIIKPKRRVSLLNIFAISLGKFWRSNVGAYFPFLVLLFISLALILKGMYKVNALYDITVYEKDLSSSWKNWSWDSVINLNNTNVRYSDTTSLSFSHNPYGAVYLHTDSLVDINTHDKLQFMLRAGADNQNLQILFYDSNKKPLDGKHKLADFGGTTVKDKWMQYNIPLSKSGASKISGFAIQNATNQVQATSYLDNIYLKASGSGTATPADSSPTVSAGSNTTTTPTNVITGGYTTSGGNITKDGRDIKIKGVNWFGFEGGTNVVHGLWARNYKEMVAQMRGLGFNAVRVPFCPSTVKGVTPTSINYDLNPDLKGLNSIQVMDKVLNEINAKQMYILLDHHTPDCTTISDLWYTDKYSEGAWINDLKTLAGRYKSLPFFMGIDLKNEPKGPATWGTGNVATDWNTAAEKAGKEVLAVNPNIVIFVEGVQDNPTCSGNTAHFWGGNFEPVNCKTINNNFIPANKLVYSPHVYGPDVHAQSYFSASNFPSNMPDIWNTHFGYLKDKGYTVIPGEWGGKYGNGGLSSDVTWHNALVNYYKSKKICSSFYWDWNPNSSDTGGILQNDWKTPWQNKVDMLNNFYTSCSM